MPTLRLAAFFLLVLALIAGCSGQSKGTAHQSTSASPRARTAADAASSGGTGAELANPARVAIDVRSRLGDRHQCAAPSQTTQPTPRAASDLPGAPQTIAFMVGTVCSAATGQPLAGAAAGANLQEQSCQEGHQPWRCAATAVTDGSGYYAIAVFSPGMYQVTVQHPGYQTSQGDVRVTGPGTFIASWPI